MNIYVMPGIITTNPYLTLLYNGIRSEGTACNVSPFAWGRIWMSAARREPTILHIHWETNIYGSRFVFLSVLRGSLRFAGLFLLRLFGVRIVWTMHNFISHDYPHPRVDRWGRAVMWLLAQGVIIQNSSVAKHARTQHPNTRIEYIPHGNYIGVYGAARTGERKEARRRFHLDDQQVVLLALGLVRPYKRYEQLIDLFVSLSGQGSSLTLMIAGKGEDCYFAQLRVRASDSRSVVFHEGYVPDEEMPYLLAAADYAVFAYGESSLTSGAMMLSLSYGLPVVAAGGMPASEIIEHGVNGYLWHSEVGKEELFRQLPELPPLDKMRVIASVESYSWVFVAKETIKFYRSLI